MASLTESEREALRDYEQVVCNRGAPDLPDSFGSLLNDALNRIETSFDRRCGLKGSRRADVVKAYNATLHRAAGLALIRR